MHTVTPTPTQTVAGAIPGADLVPPTCDLLTAAAAAMDDADVRTLLHSLEVYGLAAGGHGGPNELAEQLDDGEATERVWGLYARVARGVAPGLVVLGVGDPPPALTGY